MAQEEQRTPEAEIDPIWSSSRTARQIYALGEVEKDITQLLSLAASSVSLLALPQTDEPEDELPQGEERSEEFVAKVSEYFERLEAIQVAIRSSLAHIRQSRIAPSAINAPPPNFVPPSLGVSIPTPSANVAEVSRGLQEERVDRDAWVGILNALRRLKVTREQEQASKNAGQSSTSTSQ
ncbi:hypothetical protein PISMIDRAFT_26626 [Pisolithus microcarpus 441]|uniref:Mediator of RNA polymerase II transcription subunit 11 n=1 Tax=Pisolithus microcarpus 441 TaxID=765257 RepID=A0A0D0ADG8_9AGAM|nr:hypothetical protein PISMIDRAFT_26626 [Pisolithus microcarpus 441]